MGYSTLSPLGRCRTVNFWSNNRPVICITSYPTSRWLSQGLLSHGYGHRLYLTPLRWLKRPAWHLAVACLLARYEMAMYSVWSMPRWGSLNGRPRLQRRASHALLRNIRCTLILTKLSLHLRTNKLRWGRLLRSVRIVLYQCIFIGLVNLWI